MSVEELIYSVLAILIATVLITIIRSRAKEVICLIVRLLGKLIKFLNKIIRLL